MGLAKRIIPTLLFRGEQLVKGSSFFSWRVVGHVEQAAQIYAHRAVDEIVLLDIEATQKGLRPNLGLIEKIARNFYTPLTVGGGVRCVQDVRLLLSAGADKVAVGAAIFETNIVREVAEKFGRQVLVASLDIRDDKVVTHGGSKIRSHDVIETAKMVQEWGAGEILLTSVGREGTMRGYELDWIGRVAKAVDIPVIAHGGCSGYRDMLRAIEAGASAVAAGALFQFTDATPKGAALYLAKHSVEVRIT